MEGETERDEDVVVGGAYSEEMDTDEKDYSSSELNYIQ